VTLLFRVGEMPHLSSFGVSLANDAGRPDGAAGAAAGATALGVSGATASGFLHAIAVDNAAITTRETVFFMDFITALRG
jgi:hypothetical protein